jgi:hypothetical protein
MRPLIVLAGAAAAAALGAGAASAAPWLPMIERQALLNERIDAGLAAGDVSAPEAQDLRAEMSRLVALEGRYRYGGLSAREKLDLDRQYGALDDELRLAQATAPSDSLATLEDREAVLQARIDRGVAAGELTGDEAAVLRDDIDAIARAETNYRVDGLSDEEFADLNRRYDALADRIDLARTDPARQYGWNRY